MDGTILIADDDRTIRTVLTQAFTRAGCKVHATASLVTLMRWINEGLGDLVISDVVMPDGNGLDTLPRISAIRADLPVIIISAQNTIMTAIRANEAAAFDYLPKPFDLPDLMRRAAGALERKKPKASHSGSEGEEVLPLIGRTPAMQTLYRVIARVLNADLPVLIEGESGAGKSLVARVLHEFSDRRNQPFVVLTPEETGEAASGHEKLRAAGRGTLLIDRIEDLSPEDQARIVQALDQTAREGPRLLATCQDVLSNRVEMGTFRADLYYRLSPIIVAIPPLRQRLDDIPLLAAHFAKKHASSPEKNKSFEAKAIEKMKEYTWPGNVRQLENMVRKLGVTSLAAEFTLAEVEADLGVQSGQAAPLKTSGEKLSQSIAKHLKRYFDLHGGALPPTGLYGRILKEMEVPLLEIALEASGGNQAKCAELLGINRNTLRKKLTEHEILVTRRRKLM